MATVQLRRGLPRVAGGEPWPPSGAAVTGAETDDAAVDAAATDAGAPVAEATVEEATTAVSVPSVAAAAASAPVAGSAGAGAPVALRRGLPRVAGGEPWPPAASVGSADMAGGAASAVVSGHETPGDVAASAAQSAQTAVIAGASGHEAPSDARTATGRDAAGLVAAGTGTSLRRGLPRVVGGEPWPPADAVAAQVAPAAVSAGGSGHEMPSEAAEAALRQPQVATVAQAAVVAQGSEAAASGPDLTTPLPFTRTVFRGTAPRHPAPVPEPQRVGPFTRGQWAGIVVVGGAGLLFAAAMVVLAVRVFVSLPFMVDFMRTYPGQYALPASAPVGFPVWLNWSHFLNVFFIVLIVRTGLGVRHQKRPSVFWTPRGATKRKVSLTLWTHQALDVLWIVNGVVFVVLLFVSGQWMRLVPTSWTVFPNAVSAALQYASLDWPHDDGWINYNSLQQLTYFGVVFVLAPLAILTGVRMSTVWPKDAKGLNKAYPVEWARAVHFPVMLIFMLFLVVHVFLVFATGALRNLNHMYGASDQVDWVGFWWFAASLLVIAAGLALLRPLILAPIARLFGTVSGR